MPNQKHWTASSPHRSNAARPSHKVWTPEEELPIVRDQPCDGYEAGRLLQLYGVEAVETICERVGKFGTKPRKERVSA